MYYKEREEDWEEGREMVAGKEEAGGEKPSFCLPKLTHTERGRWNTSLTTEFGT